MPIPLLPLLGGAIATGANYLFNKKSNQEAYAQNKEFWDYTHNIQRSEAIADRDYMNQYNSPEAQMRRYKDAGLNPNLIYGQQNMMPAVKGVDGTMGNIAPTKIDLNDIGQTINSYYTIESQRQQIDNMKKQSEVMDSVKKLNDAKAISELIKPGYLTSLINSTDARTNLSKQEYQQKSELFPSQLSVQQLLVGKIKQDILTSTSTQRLNEAKTKTENRLREINYQLMNANRDYTVAQKAGRYQDLKESQERVKNLIKERNRVEVDLGLLGRFKADGGIIGDLKEWLKMNNIMGRNPNLKW